MVTSRSNIACLRAAFIGSIRAWLPSRRSVDSHRGAVLMVRDAHCRSGRSMAGKGRERWQGMPEGRCLSDERCVLAEGCVLEEGRALGLLMMMLLLGCDRGSRGRRR